MKRSVIIIGVLLIFISSCCDCEETKKTVTPGQVAPLSKLDSLAGAFKDSATFLAKAADGKVIDDSTAHVMIYNYIYKDRPVGADPRDPSKMTKTIFVDFDNDAIQQFVGALVLAERISGKKMEGMRFYFANYGATPTNPSNKDKYTIVAVPTDRDGKELVYLANTRPGGQIVILPFNDGNLCPPPPPPCLDYDKQILLNPNYLDTRKKK